MKLFSFFSIVVAFLLVIPSYFQVNAAKVCPEGGQFGSLCNIQVNDNTDIFQRVFTIMLVVAVMLAVGFLIYGGIKWITSGGDKGKVDAARGTITAAIIGLIIAFLAFFIIGVVNYIFGIQGGGTNGTNISFPKLVN